MKIENLQDTPEDAAAEEEAELVGYNTLRTMFDQIQATCKQASGIIDDLIADETETPTETAAQEDAEEAVETARLSSLVALCQSAANSLYACLSLANQINAEDITVPRYGAGTVDCPTCDGSGTMMMNGKKIDCTTCDGTGQVMRAATMKSLVGARHSSGDTKIIQGMHDHSVALGAECSRTNLKTMSGPCSCGKDYSNRALETIRHEGGQWVVYSKDGTRRLGAHMTKESAEQQELAIRRSLTRQGAS